MAVLVEVKGKKLTRDFTIPILWSVSNLKGSIKAWCGIEDDRQVLDEEGWRWSDGFSFRNHPKVVGRSDMELDRLVLKFTLQVSPLTGDPQFSISVRYKSDVIEEFRVRETQTVKELKELIVAGTNSRYFDVDLKYLGHIMEDDCSLRDYCLCFGSQVEAFISDD